MSRYRVVALLGIVIAAALLMMYELGRIEGDDQGVLCVPAPLASPGAPQLRADLVIREVWIERHASPDLPYQVFAIIANRGQSAAFGFGAGCTYQCPGEDLSGGMDIVRYAYLRPQSQLTFRGLFQFTCAEPPAEIELNCDVDWRGDITESDELNNRRTFSVLEAAE